MKETTEAKIQQEIVMWFNNTHCLKANENRSIIFSVPNESTTSQHRQHNTGLLRGVSDLIVIHKGKCLFIEVKTEKGAQSDYQKEFESRIKQNGFEYYLVRSLEQFKSIIP